MRCTKVHRQTSWVVVIFLGLLTGCMVGPNYHKPRVDVADHFGETNTNSATSSNEVSSRVVSGIAPVSAWWRTFQDPVLDQLVDQTLKGNLDLRMATERVRQARAQRQTVAAGLWPEIDAGAGYNRARGSKNVVLPLGGGTGGTSGAGSAPAKPAAKPDPPGDPPAGNDPPSSGTQTGSNPSSNLLSPLGKGGLPGVTTELYQAGFDSIWELDVFGGTSRQVEAATADIRAAVENRRDIMVTLLAEVARNYLDLRGAQRQEDVAKENLVAQRQILELTRSMQRSGLASELDVSRAASQVATTAATMPPFVAEVHRTIHALSTLIGGEPNSLLAELENVKPAPTLPPEVPVGLPSDLIRRRPDVRRAENQVHAATARIGSAKADLFPKFSLTGSAGFDSSSIKHLFDWQSHYFLISPTVTWPIFNAGRIKANVRLQEAARQESLLQYRNTILAALREVEDTLVAYSTEQERRTALRESLEESRQTLEIARNQYQNGLVDFLTVLDAQRTVLAAEQALTQSEQTVSTDLVALYKALGGGWAVEQPR
jgi:outer membrane protein, multidrug efflux system